jgi:hypothetical protein
VKIIVGGKEVLKSHNCNGCHMVDPTKGLYGTSTNQSFEGISQIFKIPQLRNVYQKIGRFGQAAIEFSSAKDTGHLGDQIRGYGMVHDGGADTVAHFLTVRVFRPTLNSGFPILNPDATRNDVAEYVHAIDTDLAPVVGQQVTLDASNASTVNPRIDLLIQRAKTVYVSKELGGSVTECDLVAQVAEAGKQRGYFFDTARSLFVASDGSSKTDATLRSLARTAGQEVTYTCAPPGSGRRMANAS